MVTTDTMFKIVMTSCKSYLTFLISEFTNTSESVRSIIIQNNELTLSNAKERKRYQTLSLRLISL